MNGWLLIECGGVAYCLQLAMSSIEHNREAMSAPISGKRTSLAQSRSVAVATFNEGPP